MARWRKKPVFSFVKTYSSVLSCMFQKQANSFPKVNNSIRGLVGGKCQLLEVTIVTILPDGFLCKYFYGFQKASHNTHILSFFFEKSIQNFLVHHKRLTFLSFYYLIFFQLQITFSIILLYILSCQLLFSLNNNLWICFHNSI